MIRLPRVSRTNPCKICGKTDYCGYMELKGKTFCICMRESEGAIGVASNGGYKHFVEGGSGSFQTLEVHDRTSKAPMSRINSVYKELLSMLTLSSEHTEANLARGFSSAQLETLQYKTVEDKVSELEALGLDLSYVPGFYKDEFGKFAMPTGLSGYFIPVRDKKQRIQAMQIRLDSGKPKYLWFSSNGLDVGASSGSPVHRSIIGYSGGGSTWITEAPIKADFISAKLKVQSIGIAGVNAGHKEVVNALLEPGHRDVIIAFDGNWQSNHFVCRALLNFIMLLNKEVPCNPKLAIWKGDMGFDDAYQENIPIDIMSTQDWLHQFRDEIYNISKDNNLVDKFRTQME